MPAAVDMSGKTFGFWKVVCKAGSDGNGIRWLCRCQCGTERAVSGSILRAGHSQSCGCETVALRVKKTTKHSMAGTPEYKAWHSMIARCENPEYENYPRYGGRGIEVCGRWKESYLSFYEDMGPRPSPKHSLHRVDNDGNYEPENCVWANVPMQQQNKRSTRYVTYKGETNCLSEWARRLGVKRGTLRRRLDVQKLPVEEAFERPVRPRRPHES